MKVCRKAQSTMGYVILFAVIVSALVVMARYMRNTYSGKLRNAGDVFGGGEVYEPYGSDKTTVH